MTESDAIDVNVPPSGTGCVECEQTNSWWLHLRRCAECGHIGCCDDSLGRHARVHFETSGHPIMQSFEPGEHWFWDWSLDAQVDGPALALPDCHPDGQSVPGPAERAPADWQAQLLAARERRSQRDST
jgi:hypothetical protein